MMISNRRIKWIKDDDRIIAFDIDTLEIIIVDKLQYDIIQSMLSDKKINDVSGRVLTSIKKYLNMPEEYNNPIPDEDIRLTLNVANTCNMNCGYCFANGGHYLSDEKIMSTETAKRAVDVFFEHFGRIGSVKFIGGEPLVNWNTIKFVCDYISDLYENGRIDNIPHYIIATNGMILTQEIIDYTNKFDFSVGLSFDGPDWIHDMVRLKRDGSKTSEIIKQNIKRWQNGSNGKYPSSINACYSGVHETNGVSVLESAMYIRDGLGVKKVNIVPVDASKNSEFKLYCPEKFGDIGEELSKMGDEKYKRYAITKLKKLEKLLRERYTMPRTICKAGITTFGVSANGLLSPCHMLTDDDGFYMGSIFDENPFESTEFKSIQNKLINHSRYDNAECRDCFAHKICIGCLGGNLFRNGDPWKCDPEICEIFRRAVVGVIKRIAAEKAE